MLANFEPLALSNSYSNHLPLPGGAISNSPAIDDNTYDVAPTFQPKRSWNSFAQLAHAIAFAQTKKIK